MSLLASPVSLSVPFAVPLISAIGQTVENGTPLETSGAVMPSGLADIVLSAGWTSAGGNGTISVQYLHPASGAEMGSPVLLHSGNMGTGGSFFSDGLRFTPEHPRFRLIVTLEVSGSRTLNLTAYPVPALPTPTPPLQVLLASGQSEIGPGGDAQFFVSQSTEDFRFVYIAIRVSGSTDFDVRVAPIIPTADLIDGGASHPFSNVGSTRWIVASVDDDDAVLTDWIEVRGTRMRVRIDNTGETARTFYVYMYGMR